ncbi:MAG: GAF domain-containing protein, partial [Candidatus Paceibacterota bacterium]
YVLSAFFVLADIFTLDFIGSVKTSPFFSYYSYPGSLYIWWLGLLYFGLTCYSFYSATMAYFTAKDTVLRNQLKYALLGAPFGILGGATSYFLFYDIPIPPFGLPLIIIYFGCLNYAMIRHRLMDVRTVIGTTGVYLLSSLLVIVWAQSLSYLNMTLFSLPLPIFTTVAAATSVILFLYSLRLFNKIAARYFYYSLYALKDAIAGLAKKLNRTIDLESILISIDYTLLGSLRLEGIGIVLRDPETNVFSLQHFIGLKGKKVDEFAERNKIFLASVFKKTKGVLIKDEIPVLSDAILKKYPNRLNTIKQEMDSEGMDALIPLLIEENPIGFIVLGKKLSLSGYSKEEARLLEEFSVQAAVVLNSAIALNQAEKREAELQKFYKLTLGRELKMIELKNKIKEMESNK